MLPLSYNYNADYCELCQDTEDDVCIITDCNHVFHKKCIHNHLKHFKRCPVCAKRIYRIKESYSYIDYILDFFLCC